MDGLSIHYKVETFHDVRGFVERCVRAGIARCVSPERESLCDKAATHIYWQDQAEFYPCCSDHAIGGPQWSGSTRWMGYKVEVIVIADRAQQWLADLERADQERCELELYERGAT